MEKENRLNLLCREIMENQERMTKGGVKPSEAIDSLVRYYTMFRYSFEDFRTLYKVHYLPAAKAVGVIQRKAYTESMFKDSVALSESYFEKAFQEKLQEGYVSLYHRVEALISHLDFYFSGYRYGMLSADSSRKAEGSVFDLLEEWNISKALLHKSDKKNNPPPNYCINRLRLIANGIKHDGGVILDEAPTSKSALHHGKKFAPPFGIKLDDDNCYILDEVTFFNDMATINLYCDLIFKLTFRLDLQTELNKLAPENLNPVYEYDSSELLEAAENSKENTSNIKQMVEAICSNNERAFIGKLILLGIAQKSESQDPDELYVWLSDELKL